MRMLQIGKFYYPVKGGMESHLRCLCEGIKDHYELQVIVANKSITTKTEVVNGVKVTRVGNMGEFRSNSICLSMPLSVNKYISDIVHIHFPNPMAHLAYLLSRQKGKLVITWHSDIIKQRYLLKIYKPFLNRILHRADRIIVTSANYAEHSPLLNSYRSKCTVIPLGIHMSKFSKTGTIEQKAINIKKKFGEGKKLILFVGRLTSYKGLAYLIEAMKSINANLLIVGNGEEYTNVQSLIKQTAAKGKIFLCGDVPDNSLPAYYHACDVLILPSTERSEAFGIVQLEAFACGKPVVSTNIATGVPFINQHRKTGFIVPPKDSSALAGAVNELLCKEEMRIKYGHAALERVKKEFTVQKMIDDSIDLYENL